MDDQTFGKELQSNKTLETDVLGFVHHAHPATAQFFQDAVVRDGLPEERVGFRHSAVILGIEVRQINE